MTVAFKEGDEERQYRKLKELVGAHVTEIMELNNDSTPVVDAIPRGKFKQGEHIRIALSSLGSEFSKLFRMIGNAIIEEEKEVFSRRAISERRFDDLPVHPARKVKPSLLLIKLADRAER